MYEDASVGGRLLESLRVGSLLSVQVTKVIRVKKRETEREVGRQAGMKHMALTQQQSDSRGVDLPLETPVSNSFIHLLSCACPHNAPHPLLAS